MHDRVTHYKLRTRRALCGRDVPPERLTTEFGEVGCTNCNRVIHRAGMIALGFTGAEAQKAWREGRAGGRPSR